MAHHLASKTLVSRISAPLLNAQPRTSNAAVAAGGAAAGRVECGVLEDEVACLATRRPENQDLPTGTDAALDVAEVFLEHFDGEAKIPAEIVKLPFTLRQSLNDLLTSGTIHLVRLTVLGVLGQPLVDWHIVDVQFLDHTDPVAYPHAD